MKKFLAVFLILILNSCSDAPLPEDLSGEITEIYGTSFNIVATRSNSNSPWYFVTGSGTFTLEEGDTETTGLAYFNFNNYLEPQFCSLGNSCECTGASQNNFSLSDLGSTLTNENPADAPYNIFNPYVNNSPDNTQNQAGEVYQIYAYQISVKPIAYDFSPNCRAHIERDLTIQRFFSGELIVRDGYRDLLLRPLKN